MRRLTSNIVRRGIGGAGIHLSHRSIPRWIIASLLALATMVALPGCQSGNSASASNPVSSTFDQRQQAAMTPAAALVRLTQGNRRFVAGQSSRYDYVAQMKATSTGQYPFAVVIACLDSRTAPEIIFDQGIGDLFVARVAGNYAPVDVIGSTEFGTKVAGAKLVVVLGHTECGAIKGACDNVELGNLTTVIQALHHAVDDVKDVAGERTSKNSKFVLAVTQANVRRTVAGLRANSPILRDLETSGQIKIVGAMYDISTGEVSFLD